MVVDMSAINRNKTVEYHFKEELINSITHAIGVVLGVVGLALLLTRAFEYNADAITIASMSVYGGSLILLFSASTLYHAVQSKRFRRLFKTLDHCAIYLLIAGSYTPFLLVSLRTPLAIGLMAVIWTIALAGVILKIGFVYKYKRLSLVSYLFLGWLSVISVYQLSQHLVTEGLVLLAAGGLVYSLGVIFYVINRIPYNHAIWHGFVLGGAACHFVAIYFYVQPV